MDGFRDYHTKLARQWKRDILWYHLYVNLKNGYKWTYLQKRNRCTGFEDKLTITKGSRWQGGMDWRSETDICTLRYMEWLANGHLVYSTRNCTQYSVIIWGKTLKEKKKRNTLNHSKILDFDLMPWLNENWRLSPLLRVKCVWVGEKMS